jgi:hypothetical protein
MVATGLTVPNICSLCQRIQSGQSLRSAAPVRCGERQPTLPRLASAEDGFVVASVRVDQAEAPLARRNAWRNGHRRWNAIRRAAPHTRPLRRRLDDTGTNERLE